MKISKAICKILGHKDIIYRGPRDNYPIKMYIDGVECINPIEFVYNICSRCGCEIITARGMILDENDIEN